MKQVFYGILMGAMLTSFNVKSADDFFDDIMTTEEMKQNAKQNKTIEKGTIDAAKLLDSKPKMLTMGKQKKKVRIEKKTVENTTPIVYEPAPMGLLWLAPISEIEYIKVKLSEIEVKDYPNTYKATNLPKSLADFRETLLSFGKEDSLWRILSYGKFINDDSSASKGLAQYYKYYEMLDKKYGNTADFYTPAIYNVEEPIPNEDGTTSTVIKQLEMQIGDEGFLEKLASGEAVLYSTFHNEKVAVTLALVADGNMQSFIVIEYKNLLVEKKANEEIYDAL